MDTRTIIVVPTYDARENLPRFISAVLAAADRAEILVVDDDSPDGTGMQADLIAAAQPRVHVLHRTERTGLGGAYRAGFAWALEAGYDLVVQMDCDLSHPPERLPGLLSAASDGADLVIASRYVAGGGTAGWPAHRRLASRAGCLAARCALRLPFHDVTGGYKVWRADALRAIDIASTVSTGFVFQVETTRRAQRAGLVVRELPFVFRDRTAGKSKMRPQIVIEGARVLLRLRRDSWRPASA
jgi:dolichol-phosphate mannosyltransferase